ncbi:MAG: hypothetical protein EP343_12025 [Deltaproteobacteria bacterium]|nr:MAG: hypothetical protein EP343_12025 [Deltaproteobacteria bacterium]
MTQSEVSQPVVASPASDDWTDRLLRLSESNTLCIALAFLFAFAMFAYYQFLSPFIPGTDGYYHIKFAYLMRTKGFLKTFPWASMSIWSETFYDKEFLYHVYLMPFTYFKDLTFGAKLATVVLASISTTSFYAILRFNKVRLSSIWFLLLMSGGGYFLYRNNVPRPQVLSIILALWSIHFILNNKRIALFVLGVVYAFSYTAYFLPVVFSCIVSGYLYVFEDELEWKTPAVTVTAMLTGMLLHPYFPNNFTYLYLQNFYVLWMSVQKKVNLRMGNEFGPMNTRQLLGGNAAAVTAYISVYFFSLYRPRTVSKTTRNMFFLSLAVILLTFHTKRFTEYSVPISLLFCGFYFHHQLSDINLVELWRNERNTFLMWACGVGLLVLSLGVGSFIGTSRSFNSSPPRHKGAALYLKKHTKDNEVVFTCDWDDGPELIFFNHKNRYLVLLDPNFMYFWKPKLWIKWDRLAHGNYGKRSYSILKNDFKVRYGVCTREFWNLRKQINRDSRMKIVYSDKETYVFKLKP